MAYAGTVGRGRSGGLPGRLVWIALCLVGAALAGAPVAYMLWPAPRAISPDAPSLPITIGGVAFNVPPAAIRFKVPPRPGEQARVDLPFLWASLTPTAPTIEQLPTDNP